MTLIYNQWVRDGKPFLMCQPGLDLRATLGRHGYTGPATGYPDEAHLQAAVPEDHTPFSRTPWPGDQPYPYCLAIDIMPNLGVDTVELAQRLVADKMAGHPGTTPIKYINWTDADGNCWHDEWQPTHERWASTDVGHDHISFRTDFVVSDAMATYDPLEERMSLTAVQAEVLWNSGWIAQGLASMTDPIIIPAHTATDSEPWAAPGATLPNKLAQALKAAGVPGGDHTHDQPSTTGGVHHA